MFPIAMVHVVVQQICDVMAVMVSCCSCFRNIIEAVHYKCTLKGCKESLCRSTGHHLEDQEQHKLL